MEELDRIVLDSLELMTKEELSECKSCILELLVILEAVLGDELVPSQE